MFIRTKKRKNGNFSMQIVQNTRIDGTTKQKVIKHVGTVSKEEDLEELKKFGYYLLRQIEEEEENSLFNLNESDKINQSREYSKSISHKTIDDNVLLNNLEEVDRKILGFNDIYGSLFEEIGFNRIFGNNIARNKSSIDILKHIVISRIANPLSKRASVNMLSEEFGIDIALEKVYRMMDKIDEDVINKIKLTSYKEAKSLFNDKIDVIFYDATTLYFESFDEDELRQKGYSNDMKFNQTQILLTIFATKEGVPIGYDIFEGSFYEGHSLVKTLDTIKNQYSINKVIFIADSGLLNKDNLQLLENNKYDYIIGAREKNCEKEIQDQILDSNDYNQISDELSAKEIKINDNQRLIAIYSKKRAYKDKKDRENNIEKLRKKLTKSKNSKDLISNYGYKKYLTIENSKIELNEDKIKEQEKWDGIFTCITNHKDLKPIEIISQYKNLWQIEETFRISKHNLKFRPIYHHSSKRIKSHIAICFISLTLIRNLMHKTKMQYKNLPPIQINNALKKAQISILKDKSTNKLYALPSKVSIETLNLYKIVKKKWIRTPFAL
jgi:transposase